MTVFPYFESRITSAFFSRFLRCGRSTATELDDLDLEDGGTIDAEDVLAAEMAARAEAKNLSFFAFTATPKAKTLELFGHKGIDGTPHPFHLYSMQQAIEEGFILDVLRNYTPYKTAFRLTHNGQTYQTEDTAAAGTIQVSSGPSTDLVDKSAAIKSVMNWVKLHLPPTSPEKVQIIIEHFRENVGWRLDGKAKAMVVTSSRKAAVRYKLAFDKYVAEKGYTDVAALVAFSGEVTDDESGLEKVTETSMNPGLKGRDLRDAFATDEYQVMLVANKFQTGFDQPLLVAMYVDKRLSGVAAVQTLSRLNRVAAGKDQTFVLDFANTAEDIVEAFEPYYEATTLADETDPNIVHGTMAKLDAAGIYQESEVNGLVADYLANKGNNALTKWVTPARDRFRDRERDAMDHGDKLALDELQVIRKDVGTFIRQYDFLLESVMVKGYQTLVDEDTTVSHRDGMEAALKLNEIARKDEGAHERAQILADMGRIIEVVRTFIPSEQWPDVLAALRGETPVSQQTSQAVQGVRMVDIDDTPDEDGN
jgi:type I restriction enzyme R subunit